MKIDIKLCKEFEEALAELCAEDPRFLKFNGVAPEQLNHTDFIDNFVDKAVVADASIDGSANVGVKDITSLTNEMNKPHTKLLCFSKLFYELKKAYGLDVAKEWLRKEYFGFFYLHDAYSATLVPYCYAYNLKDLATKGLYFVKDFNAQAPEHLTTFTDFVTEYVSWVSNRTSGGCGLPDFFVWSYYFWKKDVEAGYYLKSPEYYRDQEFQRHIYKLNQPFLRTTQSAYTTQSVMDRNYIMGLFGGMEYPDGSLVIDYVDEILDYQLAFMKVYQECHKKNMMTFPVMSYALIYDYDKGKFEDEEFAKKCSDMNCYWMDANFSVDDSVNSLSSCCRLRNDLNEINLGNFSSIGGSALEVGSVKVNSINLARLAYMYDNEEDYLVELEKIVELDCKVLHTVRHIIKRNVEKGLLPNYSLKMIDMDKQYGTIGVAGLYECVDKFGYIDKDEFGYVYYSDAGISFAKKIFDVITSVKNKMTKEFGDKYNIEQIPGERACSIFMEKDKLLFPNEKYDHALYSNQHISLSERATMAERVRVGEQLDSYMGGGVITHFNTDTPISEDNAWNLLNYIAGHKLKYFAFNSKQNACKHNHAFYGDTCPECGGPVASQWTRIVGFARPISSFSKARREETGTRTWDEPLCK